jgi:hypothetical protein
MAFNVVDVIMVMVQGMEEGQFGVMDLRFREGIGQGVIRQWRKVCRGKNVGV